MGFPVTFVVFGATGDLMKRKALPALFHMFQSKDLPENFMVLGVSRKKLSNLNFREHVKKALKRHKDICSDCEPKMTGSFLKRFSYVSADASKKGDYKKIRDAIHKTQNNQCTNTLYYFSIPPKLYSKVIGNLRTSNLLMHCEGKWSRLVIEKPVDLDKTSFRKIKKALKSFSKDSLYFIDHYLGKEVLRRIKSFRAKNKLLGDLCNNKNIKSIEVKIWEGQGVDDRAPFYDMVGALRDVGQNHALEMIALTLSDLNLDTCESREEVIKSLRLSGPFEESTYRSQYEGYLGEKGVNPHSLTETYFELMLESRLPKYTGIPIFVSAGKGMGKTEKYIRINFSGGEFISFELGPKEGIRSKLLSTQRPNFKQVSKKSLPYLEEYQKLIFDAMWGEANNFVSLSEINASWNLIDPILKYWSKKSSIKTYTSDDFKIKRTHKPKKSIGIIGLGKMGSGLALQLLDKGWEVHGYNRTDGQIKKLEKKGLIGASSIGDLVGGLKPPRVVWLMVPQGKPVQEILFLKGGLTTWLSKGDLVIDGGNSYYIDSVNNAKKLEKYGIKHLDVGVSGGPSGARNGACLMIGGNKRDFERNEHLFRDLSVLGGYDYFKGHGAGHFVKMIHNGIEYGIMQSIAEGFNILKKSKYDLNLRDVASVYNHGSVIESKLIGWLDSAFFLHTSELKKVTGRVHHTGEGEWTVMTAKKTKLKAKIIEEALKYRINSKKSDYTGKIVSALREQFGGHSVK